MAYRKDLGSMTLEELFDSNHNNKDDVEADIEVKVEKDNTPFGIKRKRSERPTQPGSSLRECVEKRPRIKEESDKLHTHMASAQHDGGRYQNVAPQTNNPPAWNRVLVRNLPKLSIREINFLFAEFEPYHIHAIGMNRPVIVHDARHPIKYFGGAVVISLPTAELQQSAVQKMDGRRIENCVITVRVWDGFLWKISTIRDLDPHVTKSQPILLPPTNAPRYPRAMREKRNMVFYLPYRPSPTPDRSKILEAQREMNLNVFSGSRSTAMGPPIVSDAFDTLPYHSTQVNSPNMVAGKEILLQNKKKNKKNVTKKTQVAIEDTAPLGKSIAANKHAQKKQATHRKIVAHEQVQLPTKKGIRALPETKRLPKKVTWVPKPAPEKVDPKKMVNPKEKDSFPEQTTLSSKRTVSTKPEKKACLLTKTARVTKVSQSGKKTNNGKDGPISNELFNTLTRQSDKSKKALKALEEELALAVKQLKKARRSCDALDLPLMKRKVKGSFPRSFIEELKLWEDGGEEGIPFCNMRKGKKEATSGKK